MIELAEGVEFDTICREWRCKWSLDGDKASLVACQMALESVAEDLYQVDGVKAVERVVCGECLDFKVRMTLTVTEYPRSDCVLFVCWHLLELCIIKLTVLIHSGRHVCFRRKIQ